MNSQLSALVITLQITEIFAQCEFALSELPKNEPVYLKRSLSDGAFSFFQPTDNITFIQANEELTLLCPVAGNTFINETVNVKVLKCIEGKKFIDVETLNDVYLSSLACSKNVVGDYQKTGKPCANGLGSIYLLGFKIFSQFVEQIKICFNDLKASAIYSSHIINGKAIKYNIKESARRSFLSSAISVKPYELYTKASQAGMFTTLLNLSPVSDMFYLSRGHLSPDGDFIFTSGQFATYFYLNAMPEFQIINQGNWLRVERLARNLANLKQTDIVSITGGHEILQLPHKDTGVESQIHLDPIKKYIEVPKYIYKVLINERDGQAIVLITSNNPYSTTPVEICPNICSQSGIVYPGYLQDFDKGFTTCCTISSFRSVVKTLPDMPDYPIMNLNGVTY